MAVGAAGDCAEFGWGEEAHAHCGGGDESGLRAQVDVLLGELGGGEEEELVAVAIEVRVRDEDGAADVDAGIVEAGVGAGQAKLLVVGVVGVEDAVAGGHVGFAVVLAAAGLGLGLEDDGAVGLDRGEGAGLDLGFGDHVDVRGDGGCSGGVEVGYGSAVGDDLDLVEAVAVDGVGAGVLAEAGLLAVVRTGEVAGVRGSGDEVEELDGAAAFDVEVLNLLGGEGVGLLAGGGRGDVVGVGRDGDGDVAAGDGERNLRQVKLVVDVNGDAVLAGGTEA